jgi:hypothetical protein
MYLCFQVKRLKNIFALNFHSVPKYNFMKHVFLPFFLLLMPVFLMPSRLQG